jgi:hypothetical protein
MAGHGLRSGLNAAIEQVVPANRVSLLYDLPDSVPSEILEPATARTASG